MSGENARQFKKVFELNGRNPDVLNSIANLSNDEVFTPPEFANQMLDTLEKAWADSNDGENIWANSQIKFLDPFTKSGVFLREIAVRLIDGLADEFPDLQERVDHILTKQVFGIATTRLTALMARRTLYCSKKANGKYSITNKFNDESGNIWFEPLEHTWIGGKIKEISMDENGKEIEITKDGRCKYCGAPKNDFIRDDGLELYAYGLIHNDNPKEWIEKVFGKSMKFDVIVGNPPYQLEDGGFGASSAPIYQLFVSQAMKLNPRQVAMVIPSRWFAGGKGLTQFRASMLKDRGIRYLVDYLDSSEVFPGVTVRGGICYFVWDELHDGKCQITSHYGSSTTKSFRYLLEGEGDVFIRLDGAISILENVDKSLGGQGTLKSFMDRIKGQAISSLVSSRNPFGFSTTFKGNPKSNQGDLEIFRNGGMGYVAREKVTKSTDAIDKWKVFLSYASTGSDNYPHSVLGKPFLGKPGQICSETYIFLGPFDDENQAASAMSLISTRFVRFLILLRKSSQHATQTVYNYVPLLPLDRIWTDEELFETFSISSESQDYISQFVRPMDSR